MSHRKDLEKVLEFLVNEETQQAASLLHKIVVEKARDFYESEIEEDMDLDGEEEVDEAVGGDEREDFIGDIKSDNDEIDADQMFDERDAEDEEGEGDELGTEFGDEAGEEIDSEVEGDIDDKVEDLEAQLAALKAQFETLIAGEEQESNHPDLAGQLDSAEDAALQHFEGYGMTESTKFQKDVSVDLKGEGKLAGTGAKSKNGSVDKKSMFSKAPSKPTYGGEPVKFAKQVGNGKEADKSVQTLDDEDNIGLEPKKQAEPAMGQEGKFSGTGAKSKAGSVDKKSLLSKTPRK